MLAAIRARKCLALKRKASLGQQAKAAATRRQWELAVVKKRRILFPFGGPREPEGWYAEQLAGFNKRHGESSSSSSGGGAPPTKAARTRLDDPEYDEDEQDDH